MLPGAADGVAAQRSLCGCTPRLVLFQTAHTTSAALTGSGGTCLWHKVLCLGMVCSCGACKCRLSGDLCRVMRLTLLSCWLHGHFPVPRCTANLVGMHMGKLSRKFQLQEKHLHVIMP
jgi:hypothetical protein